MGLLQFISDHPGVWLATLVIVGVTVTLCVSELAGAIRRR